MKKVFVMSVFPLVLSFGTMAYAHSGKDPQRELDKALNWLKQYQSEFKGSEKSRSKVKNLSRQLDVLRSRTLLLRNELAECGSVACLKNGEVRYMREIAHTLKATQKTLAQMDTLLNDIKNTGSNN